MSNTILERIHQVIGHLVHNFNVQKNYFDKMTRGREFWLQQDLQFAQQPVVKKFIVREN